MSTPFRLKAVKSRLRRSGRTRQSAETLPVRSREDVEFAGRPYERRAGPVLASTLKVLKFGGSSLATPERVARVAEIVIDSVNGSPAVVVVSAFQDVTNQLLECARLAERRDAAYEHRYDELVARHRAAVDYLLDNGERPAVCSRMNQLFADLSDALRGVRLLGHCPPAASDFVASFGERLSALIVAAYLNRIRPARFVDARQFVVTDDQFTRANVQLGSTARATRRYFASLLSEPDRPLPVVTGFIGSTSDGRTTTIGRNGSDYTAAIVGAALHASTIEIWTDVDGVLSADPRTVSSAFVLPHITYEQAQDLSTFGAKVLHPATIAPAVAKSIPILIKNTFNPDAPGTTIRKEPATIDDQATGVSSIADVTLLTLHGSRGAGSRFAERLFRALSAAGIDVLLASQASSDQTISVAIAGAEVERANGAITQEFKLELRHGGATLDRRADQALVALVGNLVSSRRESVWQVVGALGAQGIQVNAVAESGTRRSLACIVDGAHRARALNIIHRRLFDPRKPLALAVIGVGKVGGALLDQIAGSEDRLREQGFDVTVVAVANSKRFVVEADGMDLARWRDTLAASERPMNPAAFAQEIARLGLPSVAVVDCTASAEIVDAYPRFVDANLHILTPNKRANVLPWPRYASLKALLRARQREFFYEANVGAGLPVISTLRDLVESGDTIRKIEGIFSGTLSCLFNQFDGTVPFSELVRGAHRQGFTEPDPREDLSGLDVARKLLILARETGSRMELDDVQVESLIPAGLAAGRFSPEFYSQLAESDCTMVDRLEAARARGCVLRYVATFEHGRASAGLCEILATHPLSATKGTDNSIAFTTKRYRDRPLVVQGPGAGAEVTAMGVFSDMLKLLRSLPQ